MRSALLSGLPFQSFSFARAPLPLTCPPPLCQSLKSECEPLGFQPRSPTSMYPDSLVPLESCKTQVGPESRNLSCQVCPSTSMTEKEGHPRSNGAWWSRLLLYLEWWFDHLALAAPIARAPGFGGPTTSFDGFLKGTMLMKMMHVASKQKTSRTG